MKKVTPSGITFLSLLFGTAALYQYVYGEIWVGLVLNLLCAPLDGLDGYAARKLNACTKFGKVFDLIVDYCVFGLFLTAIPLRLYGADIWTVTIVTLFVGSHTVRMIMNLRRKHASYHGMPDTIVPIVIALVYFTVLAKITLLVHYVLCAVYMHLWLRYPRQTDYRRLRSTAGLSMFQALVVLYVGCMLGINWEETIKKETH